MRGVQIAVAGVLLLPLAGCLGVTIPPKEVPAWAMQPQAERSAARASQSASRKTSRVVAQQRAPGQTADISFVAPLTDVKPFSPDWQAREDAFDGRLRRRMNICGGC